MWLLPAPEGLAAELEEANDFGGHSPAQGAHLSGRKVPVEQQCEAENSLVLGTWKLGLEEAHPETAFLAFT